MTERVLITGSRAPAALDMARSFTAAGYEVHLADSRPGLMAQWSGLASRVHRYAPPTLQPETFRRGVVTLLQDIQPTMIVPICEEVFHLAQAAKALGFADRLFAPPTAVLDELHSKFRFVELCGTLGLPTPRTRHVTNRAQRDAFATRAEQLVFKAEYSRFGADTLVSPAADQLASIVPSEFRSWVAQDRVYGREVCFYAVAVGGALSAFGAYRSAWRMPGGAGYAFAPLDEGENTRLFAIAHTLAAVVGTGHFACDLIIDADGQPWLIECNPRATSGVHLFGGRRELADAMTGRAAGPVIGRDRGHLGPARWRYGLPTALRDGRLSDWSSDHGQGPDVITRGGGPGPALGAILDSAAFSVQAALKGGGLERAMTRDIEWNGPGGAT
ncbi:hypothetical protein BH10PSE1_BH10PSE1_20970 [soil metagenome]